MAAYRRVYDSRHLQADCQEPGSAPGPYMLDSRVWATFFTRNCSTIEKCEGGDGGGGWGHFFGDGVWMGMGVMGLRVGIAQASVREGGVYFPHSNNT